MKPPHPVLWFNSIQPSIWLMSCATAIRLERIQREPLQRSRFRANVRQSQHLHPVVSRGPSRPMTDFQSALARPLVSRRASPEPITTRVSTPSSSE